MRASESLPRIGMRGVRLDSALAVLLVAVVCLEYAFPSDDGFSGGPTVVSLVLSVAALLPIATRRLAPLASLATGCALIALPSLVVVHSFPFFGGTLPQVFLFYTVARHRPLRQLWVGLALVVASIALFSVLTPQSELLDNAGFLGIMLALAAIAGQGLQRSASNKQRLAQALAGLVDEQANRERIAVLRERTDLARDLHDVVAHAVSLMLVQAGAARVAIDDDPDLAARLLSGVEQAGEQAIADLQGVLGALRAPDSPAPGAGLSAVPDLIARMRSAGLQIELTVDGTPPELAPGLDAAAYRILQEALTNVLKHAGPTSVLVGIRYGTVLEFTVADDGPHGARIASPTSGQGLVGMRERAALFGGSIEAGPSGDGFSLLVRLPLPVAA